MIPKPIQRIIEGVTRRRKPFVLTCPDGRVFIAQTYTELLRLTAPEFQVSLVRLPVRDMGKGGEPL